MATSRLYAYVEAETIDKIESLDGYTKSGFAREAVQEKLARVEGNDA